MFNKIARVFAMAATVLIAACGGGGDSAGENGGPVASTQTFQMRTAYVNSISIAGSKNFTVSGTVSGFPVGGSGTLTVSGLSAATFEGVAAQQTSTTLATTITSGGSSFPQTITSLAYVDANYNPLGGSIAGKEYFVVVPASGNIPVTAKVNDTGTAYTATLYTSSDKLTPMGTRKVSFLLAADTESTALLRLTSVDKNLSGDIVSTSTSEYRMTPAGDLTHLKDTGMDAIFSLTFTY